VEEILRDILVDLDAGLQLRPEFEERLRQSISYVDSGGKLLSFEEIRRRIREE
jgi:ATP-dependent Clp protease ATP-binding subunit ClpA